MVSSFTGLMLSFLTGVVELPAPHADITNAPTATIRAGLKATAHARWLLIVALAGRCMFTRISDQSIRIKPSSTLHPLTLRNDELLAASHGNGSERLCDSAVRNSPIPTGFLLFKNLPAQSGVLA